MLARHSSTSNDQYPSINSNTNTNSSSNSNTPSKTASPTNPNSMNLFGKGKMAGFSMIQTSEDIKANGLTSNTLLYLLQQKNAQMQEQEEHVNIVNGIGITDKEELILNVREFILKHEDQRVTSKEIIDHFKMKTSKKDIELIRRMLQRICTFQRLTSSDGTKKGYWVLKDEFKE